MLENTNNIYEVKHSLIFDLEFDLKFLEMEICKLKAPPKGLYVNGNRFPYTHEEHGLYVHPLNIPLDVNSELPNDINLNIIDKKGNLIVSGYNLVNKRTFFSTKPFHPILVSDFICMLVDFLQYTNCPNKDLFYFNPIINTNDSMINDIVKSMTFVEDVIYYCFLGLDDITLRKITDHVYKRILPLLNEYMLADTNAFYTINLNKKDMILSKHNDIRAIRYMMAIDKISFDNELNKRYEEDI